jgi:hypothetical protein
VADEKVYAFDLFVKEEVQKSCAKALLRYSLVSERMDTSAIKQDDNHSLINE